MGSFAAEPRKLDPDGVAFPVAVKGEYPALDYPFALRDLYAALPSLDMEEAYAQIRWLLAQTDPVVVDTLKLRPRLNLPSATQELPAGAILGALFDPSYHLSDMARPGATARPGMELKHVFRLETPRPFPLQQASPAKLNHTLGWADTNMKVQIEKIMLRHNASAQECRLVAECALGIYACLLKQEDHSLARGMNFNLSMFLQDRILNLIFGSSHHVVSEPERQRSRLANHIALHFLKELGPIPYRDLCKLAVFMGVIWTSQEEIQAAYRARVGDVLARVDRELEVRERQWCVDQIDDFLVAMGRNTPQSVLVVLDDNGESVFDLAIFQRLMQDNPKMTTTFLVNRYPVSNNISADVISDVIQDDYFHDLRRRLHSRDVTFCVEEQPFRSFEQEYLNADSRQAIASADVLYIKGANFFETFQVRSKRRWHCFVIHDVTSELLTGCGLGRGVFVRLEPNQDGYVYRSAHDVSTLREILTQAASYGS